MNIEVRASDLQKINLRRAPPPKPPVAGPEIDKPKGDCFKNVKLRPTRASTIECGNENCETNDETEDNKNNNSDVKQRASSVKDRVKTFQNGSPGKPLVPGKPPVATKKPVPVPVKPVPTNKGAVNAVTSKNTLRRPPSVLDKPNPKIVNNNKDTKVPELKPLTPESELGEPPQKPPKYGVLKPSLKKYLGTSYPPRPVASNNNLASKSEIGTVDTSSRAAQEAPAPPIPKKPSKPGPEEVGNNDAAIAPSNESASEDFYDDTTCATQSNAIDTSEDFYDDTACGTSNFPQPSEDFYDDTACVNKSDCSGGSSNDFATSGAQDETFGDDIYEPISGNQEEERNVPVEKTPPTLPAKDSGKEDKKKKEKERKRKEKEEKEREEKERKKKEKEKEKKIGEMKKRFSVKGNEKLLGTCCASEDILGDKMHIPASIGEEFDVIRKGKPNPNNKWLVRNKQGQYGFIDTNKIEKEPAADPEDLYEEVPASKMRISQTSNGSNVPTPPVSSPPPPPSQSAPRPPTGDPDIYDDVAGQDGEDLYELLPEN